MTVLIVTASITSSDQEIITRAVEALTRAAVGLALDGAEVFVAVGPDEDTEDDDEKEQP